jgi:hypothetical protein
LDIQAFKTERTEYDNELLNNLYGRKYIYTSGCLWLVSFSVQIVLADCRWRELLKPLDNSYEKIVRESLKSYKLGVFLLPSDDVQVLSCLVLI